MIVVGILFLIVISTLIAHYIVLFNDTTIEKYLRLNIKLYLNKLEEGRCNYLEKRCFNFYLKYIPIWYREIDRENGLENNLPSIFEKILYCILSPKFWFYTSIFYFILLVIILICLNLSLLIQIQTFDECILSNNKTQCLIYNFKIINNIDNLYQSIVSPSSSFIKNYKSTNEIELFINNEGLIIILLKYIDFNGYEEIGYFNMSSIELFLNKWKEEYNNNDDINYCFCPLYIGIKNNNLQFIYDYDNNNWLIIYNFTIIDNVWTRKQKLKTVIKYKDKKLQDFVSNLTNKEFLNHDKNINIKYHEIKSEKGQKQQQNETHLFINYNSSYIKEQILNIKQTSCIIHCLDLIN